MRKIKLVASHEENFAVMRNLRIKKYRDNMILILL